MRQIVVPAVVFVVGFAGWTSPANAQPPDMYPPDSAFTPITCSDPTSSPSEDSCTDEARDHRNVVGGGSTPAYLIANDGTHFFLRLRVEADPTQGIAFRSFAWGFGLDTDFDGEFEAYITLIGQGLSDRVEVLDQDPDNGITPDLTGPTALTPVVTDMSTSSYAISSPAPPPGVNFCPDDPDSGDFYITVGIPLAVLHQFGALGGAIAYGGSSSMFSGIQNDFVCQDGAPAMCTMGSTCPSGICLVDTGYCAPPVDELFIGCVDLDTIPMDGIDDGCTAPMPHCLVSTSGTRCVQCVGSGDCNDGNECTVDSCVADVCANIPAGAGTPCTGGVCDGTGSATACMPCADTAPGAGNDAGCAATTPICDTSGVAPICVACLDDTTGGTDTGCTGATPVCDTTGTPRCVTCLDDATGTSKDDGCSSTEPLCTGIGPGATCVACFDDAAGAGTDTGCTMTEPLCDTTGAVPMCTACFDDTAGGVDTGCTAGAPACATSGASATCLPCIDDAPPGVPDDGCTTPAAICDTSGAVPICVGCVSNADCPGSACDPATRTCLPCVDDAVGAIDSGCGGATPVCEDSTATPFCVACEDDDPGTGTDFGCAAGSPFCDTAVATAPVCVECFDDTVGGIDSGCGGATPVCDTSGASSVCVACNDTVGAGGIDDGCSAMTPACDTTGPTDVCVGCLADSDCTGGVCDIATNTCVACRDDALGAPDTGCAAPTPICDTSGTTPVCEACIDDMGPGLVDEGCLAPTGTCDTSGAANVCIGCIASADCPGTAPVCDPTGTCVPCVDDTIGGIDTGCEATAPACDLTGTPACRSCEDTATGTEIDNGCNAASPICDLSGTVPVCVECLGDADCPIGTPLCNPANMCAPGCTTDMHCGSMPAMPVCDPGIMTCVECLEDIHCDGELSCDPLLRVCRFGDNDGDEIPDDLDGDDDNDGIPDIDELGGTDLSADQDGDGVADYHDPSFVACDDSDGNGVCDELPASVDTDGDGVPNHFDLDTDGDGITDIVEAGGTDGDQDGRVDDFDDSDGDGVHDAIAAAPLPQHDTDGDGMPDHRDIDSDGDGIPDAIEGSDTDADGSPNVAPSGVDADGDGLDDAFDVTQGGQSAPTPDFDGDGIPDYRDDDDDGDGIPTAREVDDGAMFGDDVDGGGDPNWLDRDSDGDGLEDGTECPDGTMACPDDDGDGVPEYLDPLEVAPDAGVPMMPSRGGVSGGACSAGGDGGSGGWPLALVVLALLWRRRRYLGDS